MSEESSRGALLGVALFSLAVAAALSSSALSDFDRWLREAMLLAPGADQQRLEMVRDLTAVGSFPLILGGTLIAALMFVGAGRLRAALLLCATLICATAANLGLKLVFAKPRPPADESHIAVFTMSYPSGHALMTGVLAGALALIGTAPGSRARRVAVACAVIVTALVGVSRVILGAHWPTDVIAGWLTALALNCGLLLVLRADQCAAGPARRSSAASSTGSAPLA